MQTPTTPMMQQYLAIKASHQEYLLFYRMGDFYELFFEDAILAAREIDIVLTKRGKHNGEDIPMCGVPAHSSELYLHRLLRKGYSVAICEQLESPEDAKKRGYKAVVKREVIRIITPGTILEETLLDSKATNYLAAIARDGDSLALALADISTGDFLVESISLPSLSVEISRTLPSEIIIADTLWQELGQQLKFYDGTITRRPDNIFSHFRAESKVKDTYGVDFLSGMGSFSRAEIMAAGAMLDYLEHTQKQNIPDLKPIHKLAPNNFMQIDNTTRVNLEIERTVKNNNKASGLLKTIDFTLTAVGSRLFAAYLHSPLANALAINERLDKVTVMVEIPELRRDIRHLLTSFPDIERSFSRISARKQSPKDFMTLRDGLNAALQIAELLYHYQLPSGILENVRQIGNFDSLLSELRLALTHTYDGSSYIRRGYSAQLDTLRDLKDNADQKIEDLRNNYRSLTGINTLRINHNNIIGYYVEVSANQHHKMDTSIFIHRQSMVAGTRYVTKELQQLESDILSCDDRIKQIEHDITKALIKLIIENGTQIRNTAQAIATIDVFSALAEVAVSHDYVRPVVNESKDFVVINGRHPVVERGRDVKFIANSCEFKNGNNIWLITAPNMAGKSTFLRQVALICLMAQMGSYVPADSATVGVVDRLFSRIGAADNISQGQSTFMVEMLETAAILNNATDRSLLILDEIGRGTATYDGLSIAEAVIGYIHDRLTSRTLFATHYHELTALEQSKSSLSCYTMKVEEWQDRVVFLHQIIAGIADKSYGVHIAELAGMPREVIQYAQQRLHELVTNNNGYHTYSVNFPLDDRIPARKTLPVSAIPATTSSLPLQQGSSQNNAILTSHDKAVLDLVHEILSEIDHLTPRAALERLWSLQEAVKAKK